VEIEVKVSFRSCRRPFGKFWQRQ